MNMDAIKPIHPIKLIRDAGVPIAAFETSDPAQTVKECLKAMNGKGGDPAAEWDIVRGFRGLNGNGKALVAQIGDAMPGDPSSALAKLLDANMPKDMLVFLHNAQKFIGDTATSQAVWNLRDPFKSTGSTLILLCPALSLPPELQQDVVVITEPLPDVEQLGVIADSIVSDYASQANVKPDALMPDKSRVVDAMAGMSAFAAEQALAMSLSKKGVDRESLWNRKRKMVEQTPGLSLWKERISFDDVGGLTNIKSFLTRLLTSGKSPVRCIGFIDEIEKLFAGSSGDLSGVSQDQLRVFLTEMQDGNIPGLILVGPPGTGKSLVSKCAATVCGGETLAIDTGAMTGSLVGESQAKVRKAMETFRAVSHGKGMFIATCNRIASLPPELRRRFRLGTFYVDLPDASERNVIWTLKTKAFSIPDTNRPADKGWTGAEIEACCDIAYRCDLSLKEAAEFIVPVCKAAADQIASLRQMAAGKFISANKPGLYEYVEETVGRKMAVQ